MIRLISTMDTHMSIMHLYKSMLLICVTGLSLSSDYRHNGDITRVSTEVQRIYPGEMMTGADSARVTLIVYVNYDCTYCAAFEKEVLPALRTRFVDKGNVRLVQRIFPMTNDLTSDNFMKTELALCSAQAGRFSTTSAILFENQYKDFWKHYEQWVDASGTDAAMEVKACIAFHKTRHAVVMAQQRYAYHAVQATPTVFINGHKLEGLRPYEDYEKVIMRLLKS